MVSILFGNTLPGDLDMGLRPSRPGIRVCALSYNLWETGQMTSEFVSFFLGKGELFMWIKATKDASVWYKSPGQLYLHVQIGLPATPLSFL